MSIDDNVASDIRVKPMLDGLRGGLSYTDLCEDAPGELDALEKWEAMVRASAKSRHR